MVFYVPYQLFWIQLNALQLLKYVATSGLFAALVNIMLRPYNAWVKVFIDRVTAPKPKPKVTGISMEDGVVTFKVEETLNTAVLADSVDKQ